MQINKTWRDRLRRNVATDRRKNHGKV